jgi:hypothetical protein
MRPASREATEEAAGLLALGALQYPLGRAELEETAVVEEGDLVGDFAGEAHLVGGDHHRHPLRGYSLGRRSSPKVSPVRVAARRWLP